MTTNEERIDRIYENLSLANGIDLDENVARNYRKDVPLLLNALADAKGKSAAAESFVRDLAANGIRFDLNPTVDGRRGAAAYLDYIGRIDKSMRERAAAALSGAK